MLLCQSIITLKKISENAFKIFIWLEDVSKLSLITCLLLSLRKVACLVVLAIAALICRKIWIILKNSATIIDLPEPSINVEDLMLKSCQCYERALLYIEDQSRSNLIQRLGSVRNELGIKYMNWAQDEYAKYTETLEVNENEAEKDFPENELKLKEPLYQSLSKLSYDSLTKGITALQDVSDNVNLAFLYCNMGRFFRFRAHIHFIGEKGNCLLVQKKYYTEAFSSYERALTTLGSKKSHSDLWDLINWELSTAIFTYAKQLQDYGQSFDVSENEIADMLQKSLKSCDVEVSNSRHILYKFRSGLVHHRLASLHHNSIMY